MSGQTPDPPQQRGQVLHQGRKAFLARASAEEEPGAPRRPRAGLVQTACCVDELRQRLPLADLSGVRAVGPLRPRTGAELDELDDPSAAAPPRTR